MDHLFLAHISKRQHEKILLVGKGEDINYAVNLARANDIETEFQILDTDQEKIQDHNSDYDLIVIVDRDIASARRHHFACTHLKQQGNRVVFGLCRGLFLERPKSPPTGITYAGMFSLAADYLNAIYPRGDYLEFGVFDGRSTSLAYHSLNGVVKRFFAFDSFEGIIGTMEEEEKYFQDGLWFSNEATFWHNMQVAGVDTERISAIQGDFLTILAPDLLQKHRIERASIIHIDCDGYLLALKVLNFITDIVAGGALLLFDDYDHLALLAS